MARKVKGTHTEHIAHKRIDAFVAIINNLEAAGGRVISITQLEEQTDCPPGHTEPHCWDWLVVWEAS